MSGINKACILNVIFLLSIIAANCSSKQKLSSKKTVSLLSTRTLADNDDDDKLTYTKKESITCTGENCPYPNACNAQKNICYCAKEKANYPEEGLGGIYCQYERKKQLTCFLLECLLNSGIGHLIAGRTGVGVAKVILTFGIPIICCIYFGITLCCSAACGEVGAGCCGIAGTICGIIYFIGFFVWWLVDVIKYGKNEYLDSNGVSLEPW